MYEVLVNGNRVVKTQNTHPTTYRNVRVWSAQGAYWPVAAYAKMKNLYFTSSKLYDHNFHFHLEAIEANS